MTKRSAAVYEFDDVRVEPGTFKVFKAGDAVPLEPKALLLLVFLIENRDRMVEKSEILDVVWKNIAVTENALTREVAKLRRSLGDDPKMPRYIQTVHTRGYRFIAPVEVVDAAEETSAIRPNESQPAAIRSRRWISPLAFVMLGTLCAVLAAALLLRRSTATAKPLPAKHTVSTLAVLPFRPLAQARPINISAWAWRMR